ncbi:universal stress protein [Thermodesulfobacterium hydrogeniphilum]|uniref:universal stress protein n=1 Tax=Thermodesulfobacterium hydrogeniphilum TaxID=161156 RepID=UPI000570BC22|nr:universal stress protein [Thermodesulfobacterium hydrogeniphilum]
MCKYKKFLIATDGSESSAHAVEEALKFAKETQAEVSVISVIPPVKGLSSSLSIFGHITELARKPYVKALEVAKDMAEDEDLSIKTVLEEGEPYEKIIETAKKEGCDVIILGRRGITAFEKILIGSTATRLINESPVDLLLVPRNSQISFKKILAATDLSEHGNRAVEKAGKLAKAYNGDLAIISVIHLPPELIVGAEEIMNMLTEEIAKEITPIKEKIQKLGLEPQIFIEKGEPHIIITNKLKDIEATILTIGANQETGKKFTGSIAQKIIANSNVPILVVKK